MTESQFLGLSQVNSNRAVGNNDGMMSVPITSSVMIHTHKSSNTAELGHASALGGHVWSEAGTMQMGHF